MRVTDQRTTQTENENYRVDQLDSLPEAITQLGDEGTSFLPLSWHSRLTTSYQRNGTPSFFLKVNLPLQ